MISRRKFLGGSAALFAGCSQLVTTKYPPAAKCSTQSCTMIDAHCHVFNASDLNISGFVSHILPVSPKLTSWATDTLARELHRLAPTAKQELAVLEDAIARKVVVGPANLPPLDMLAAQLAALLPYGAVSARASDVLETLQMIVQTRAYVATRLVQTYSQIDLFTPALVDYGYWTSDAAPSPLPDQLEVHAALARASARGLIGRANARIHPFAPFNPLRDVREGATPVRCDDPPLTEMPAKGSLARLRYAVENLGYLGAKIYPPSGFLPIDNAGWVHHQDSQLGVPLDQALNDFYAYCEAAEVPVLTHANASNGFALGYGILTDPDAWERVLERYPRLRLNLGHFGDLEGDDPNSDRGIDACELWMRKCAQLMTRFPNVYADSGCSSVPVEVAKQKRYLTLLEDIYAAYPSVHKRFMFGTDFWLNRFWRNSETFVDAFASIYQERFAAQYADFFGNNALRFYGLLDDAGHKPLHRNRTRLQRWYAAQGVAAPSWL